MFQQTQDNPELEPELRRTRGRKDNDGQEAVTQSRVVAERLADLINLHNHAATVREELSDAIKASAEASGFNSKSLRQYVKARAEANCEPLRRAAEQLTLLFEEVGQ